jgi:hypothetical protein
MLITNLILAVLHGLLIVFHYRRRIFHGWRVIVGIHLLFLLFHLFHLITIVQ